MKFEIDRYFTKPYYFQDSARSLFDEFLDAPVRSGPRPPRCNLYETPDGFVIKAQLPGVARDDLSISFENGVLTIEGKVETTEDKPYSREFTSEKFTREFRLADSVDVEQAKAELRDGLLTLTLPKAERAKARKITLV